MTLSNQLQKEGRTSLALYALKQGQKTSIRAAAYSYDVSRDTLGRRQRGILSRLETTPNSRLFTDTEEEVIVRRILDLDTQGFSPRISIIREIANIVLINCDASHPQTVGKNWPTTFINRKDELRTMWNRKYDYQRAKCEDPAIIEPWFNIVRNLKAKYGILDEDTWNFDETGFQMGVIMTSKVVTRTERKGRPKTKQPGNQEWVSVVHGINAQGWAIPPLIILKGQLYLAPWYRVKGLLNDWQISVSENSWTDNEIGLEWIKHFHKHTIRRTKGQY